MKVCLVYSPQPRRVHEWVVDMPDDTTAQQGLAHLQELVHTHAPRDWPAQPNGGKASLRPALSRRSGGFCHR